jgi:hypothetical protein
VDWRLQILKPALGGILSKDPEIPAEIDQIIANATDADLSLVSSILNLFRAVLSWLESKNRSPEIAGLPPNEFETCVLKVCAWFDSLNPYEQPGSILKFEDRNFALDSLGGKKLEPLYCAAISAKRYALFNFDSAGEPVIRKASAHGLGHLLSPYDDKSKPDELESGVRLWQEDLWKEIIKSMRSPNPVEVHLDWRTELGHPAVSQAASVSAAGHHDRPLGRTL